MKTNRHQLWFLKTSYQPLRNFCNVKFLSLLFLLCTVFYQNNAVAQKIIPTKGKDFWIGFPYAPDWGSNTRRFDVFITAPVSTNGTISIPNQGWSQAFTVTANVTTTITLPVNQVDHSTSEVIENKGIQVVTQDTVSVFAIAFQQYTADASVIYPKQSLGTEYRISSYPGLAGGSPGNLNSDFLVVATEDGTKVEITTTAPTRGGKAAGVPFIVNLNKGQSYQVQSSTYTNDLTGSLIKATDSSGSCRPFAVFSGSACVNIPAGCGACDVLYDQAIPVANWGKTYYSVPFANATSYTLRIMAHENGTICAINGVVPVFLGAGQYTEINGITSTQCITGTKPFSVIQYMEGVSCAGSGDPAMMYLNSQDQKIDDVTFSTVTSTVITQHNVNVIMNTAHIGQLKLDGVGVAASSFDTMSYCSDISYASLSLSQGSHTLTADSGFTAYIYGTGSAESYAYSVGSFSKSQPIHVDSVLCTSDTVRLGSPNSLYNSWWSTSTLPNDTIGLGPVLTLLPPIVPDVYIQHGTEFISSCNKEYYFNVEVPDPPQTFVSSNSNNVCQNQQVQLNAGTIPASSVFQYSWTPTTNLSNPNSANPVLTATVSGWYKVAISPLNGCAPTVYDSIYITVRPIPLPTANAGGNQVICQGVSATLTATGGVTYLWTPGGATTNSITVTPTGTTNYIVYVTDTNGCGNRDTVKITVNTLPLANAGPDKFICPGGNISLTASGGVSYLWTPGGNTTATINAAPSVTTNYIVQVTGVNGCSASDTTLLTVRQLPVANAGNDQVICAGTQATLIASGGLNYYWLPGAFANDTVTITPANTTTYILRVTDSIGCQNRDTVTITVNPIPVANAGIDRTICAGNSTTLTATGGSAYLWNPGGSTTNQINVSPVATTDYIVKVSDAIGCNSSDTVRVTVNPLPSTNAGSDQSICSGASATLNGSPLGATGYLWTPSGSTTSSITVSPVSTTKYYLSVTDGNGCSRRDSVTVTVNPLPVANAGADKNICSTFQVSLTASGGAGYLWTPGNLNTATINVSPSASITYVVKVTDNNGCIAYDSARVSVFPYITGSATAQSICQGNSTTLNAPSGVSYLWAPGSATTNSITVNPNSTTNYIVKVTDTIGCLVIDTMRVTVNPLPAANAGIDQGICPGTSATLTALPAGASYVWTPGGSTASSVTVSPSSSQQYVLKVTDVNGCVKKDSVYVNVFPAAVAVAGSDQTICSSFQANLVASGGSTYLWSPGGATTSAITVSPAVSTNYIVKVTDVNGCIDHDTVRVNIDPYISGANVTHPICIGLPATLHASGGTSYSWTPGGSTNDTLVVSPSLSQNYIVHIVTPVGCHIYDTTFVKVNLLPAANAGNDKAICIGSNTSLTASGGVSYQWLPGSSTSNPLVVSPLINTDYVVKVTDVNGCINHDTVSVTVHPLPLASAGTDKTICPGTSTSLTASGGDTYMWNPGTLNGSTIIVSPSSGTRYIVMVTDTNGCKKPDTVFVYMYPQPLAGWSADGPICERSPVNFANTSTVLADTLVGYSWRFGDGNFASTFKAGHTYLTAGSYPVYLAVTSSHGCIDSIEKVMTINPIPSVDFDSPDMCQGTPAQFFDLSAVIQGGVVSWNWNFGDNTTSDEKDPFHIYNEPGFFDVELVATSDSGCSSSLLKTGVVEIYPLPLPYFSARPDTVSILNPVIDFIDESSGGILWNWNFGDGRGQSTAQSPSYAYKDTGNFTVRMILTSDYGCKDTTYGEVYIEPDVAVYIPSSFTPNGDSKNETFSIYGINLSEMEIYIYDRWGNKVYQNATLGAAWNGNSIKDQHQCASGVYVYVVKTKDFRGIKREYKGHLTLLR